MPPDGKDMARLWDMLDPFTIDGDEAVGSPPHAWGQRC